MTTVDERLPRVSVCLASYNGAKYIRAQVASILEQLETGDELLISDDGSTDATLSVLASFGTSLRLVATNRAGGVVPNFERVLSFASNPLVVLADQDDIWLPGRLTSFRQALVRSDLVLANALITDERLHPTGATVFEEVNAATGFWRNVRGRSSFVGCCMGFRRDILAIALPFPLGTPWHDWLLGLLASARKSVELVDMPLLLYRRHASNASLTGERSNNNLLRMLVLRIRILSSVCVCLIRAKLR